VSEATLLRVQPYAPPAAPYPGPPATPGPTGQMPLRFEIGEVLSGAWEVFTRQWLPLCVGMLLVGLFVAVPVFALYMVTVGAFMVATVGDAPEATIVLAAGAAMFGMTLAMMLLIPLFMGRLLRMTLTAVRGSTPAVGDLFKGEMRYGSMLALMLLQTMVIGLGYLFFVVPGVILALGLHFSAFLVIDRRMGAVDAMKASWQLTSGRKGQVFGVVLVFGLISAACGFVPLAGNFVGSSLMMLGLSIVYLRLMGEWAPASMHAQLPYPGAYPGAPAGPYGDYGRGPQQPYGPQPAYPPPPAGGYGGYGPYGGGGGPPPRA
jgi:uncharacterized membrane protein